MADTVNTSSLAPPFELASHLPRLRALARSLVERDRADDLVQETAVAALTAPTKPRDPRSWLGRVLRNKVHRDVRTTMRRQRRETSAHRDEGDDQVALEELVHRKRVLDVLTDALAQLPEPYQQTLRLRFFAGLSVQEIAARAGCPPGTARWRVHEGLARLRRQLDEQFEGRNAWSTTLAAVAGIPTTPTMTATKTGITMKTIIITVAGASAIVAGAIALGALGTRTERQTPQAMPGAQLVPGAEPVAAAQPLRGSSAAPVATARHDLNLAELRRRAAADDAATDRPATTAAAVQVVPRNRSVYQALWGCLMDRDPAGPRSAQRLFVELEAEHGRAVVQDVRFEPSTGDDQALRQCVLSEVEGTSLPDDVVAAGSTIVELRLAGSADMKPPAVEPSEFKPVATAGLPRRASANDEALAVIECGDYDCPYCGKAAAVIEEVLDRYPGVAFYYLHNPLPMHKSAAVKARAAIAAQRQDKFWEMHEALFAHPQVVTEDEIVALAQDIGVNLEKFEADLLDPKVADEVTEQSEACRSRGARGLPSFFVGDQLIVGAQPFENFQKLIDAQLASPVPAPPK